MARKIHIDSNLYGNGDSRVGATLAAARLIEANALINGAHRSDRTPKPDGGAGLLGAVQIRGEKM